MVPNHWDVELVWGCIRCGGGEWRWIIEEGVGDRKWVQSITLIVLPITSGIAVL